MKVLVLLAFFSQIAFGAGSATISRRQFNKAEVVVVSWTGDSSDGSFTAKTLGLFGYLEKVVTNPGSTAPSANYDIALGDPTDSALDVLATALNNRHTSTTEQVYPRIAGTVGTVSSFKPFLVGDYTLAITGNSVASATGTIEFYLSKP